MPSGSDYWLRINATARQVQSAMHQVGSVVRKAQQGMKKATEDSANSFKKLVTSIKKAYQESQRFQQAVNKLRQMARRLIYVILALAAASIKFARDQEFAEMRIRAVTKAMGVLYSDGKRISAQWVQDFAKAREAVTTFTDEVTINGAAMLTTFAGLTTHHLPKAIKIMQDMGALSGYFGDLRMAGMQLGRAIDGLYAGLRRIGVSVTQAEVDIMTAAKDAGLQFEANTMLLAIMEGQVGGIAEAINKGPLAAFDRLKMASKSALEEMGESIASNLNNPLREAAQILDDISAVLKAQRMKTEDIRRLERIRAQTDPRMAAAARAERIAGGTGVSPALGLLANILPDPDEAREYIRQQEQIKPLAELLAINNFMAQVQKAKLAAIEWWVAWRTEQKKATDAAIESARLLAGVTSYGAMQMGLKGRTSEGMRIGEGRETFMGRDLSGGWKRLRLAGMGASFGAEDLDEPKVGEGKVGGMIEKVGELKAAVAEVAQQWYKELPAAAHVVLDAINQMAETFAGAFADAFMGVKVNWEKLLKDMLKMVIKSGIMAILNKIIYGAATGGVGFAGGGLLGMVGGFIGLGGDSSAGGVGAGGAGGPGQGFAMTGGAGGANVIRLQWEPTGVTNRGHVRYWRGAEEGILSDRRDQIKDNTPTDYAEVI